MKNLLMIVVGSMLLAGCTGWVDEQGQPLTFGKAMGAVAEGAAEARAAQQPMLDATRSIMNQSQNWEAPGVQAIKQPNGTTWVYCRGVTDQLYHCRTY